MLHEYIDKNIEKGFIQHSKSLASAIIVLVKKKLVFMNVCGLSWTKLTCHQELIPFAINFKVVTPTKSCQGVHQD
jgi:hypothetical protein